MSPKKNKKKLKFSSVVSVMFFIGLVIYYLFFDTSIVRETQDPLPTTIPQVVSASNTDIEVFFTYPQNNYIANTDDSIENQLIKKIDGAQHSLNGAFFEFDLQSVADALIRAHQRGVQVQLVYDDEHTDEDPQMKQMIKSGIKAVPDERSAFMHNKFLVVDNECVWTGSFNITENAAYKNHENAIYLCSPELAKNYQTEFAEMFAGQFGPRSPENTPYQQLYIGDILVENYFGPEDGLMKKIISRVSTSQDFIHFMALSFTDESLGKSMIAKLSSGVSVAGVFETRGVGTVSSQCSKLFKNGADIRLDDNGTSTMHHKVIIIDSQIVIVGSFNFSDNADSSNDENLLIIHSPSVATQYEQEFQRLFTQGFTTNSSCE